MTRNDELHSLAEVIAEELKEFAEKLSRAWEELVAPLGELFEPREIEFPEEEKIIGLDIVTGESQTSIIWVPIPRRKPPDSVCQSAH